MTDTQLTMIVHTPSKCLSFSIYVERVVISAKDIDCLAATYRLDFASLLVSIPGSKHSTDFAALRITPAEDFALCSECQRVVTP